MKKKMNIKKAKKTLKDEANYQGSMKVPMKLKEEYGTGLPVKKGKVKAKSMR